ncbi:MAG TPA: DNA methyltransferase, partial [Paludibacteraceae bacterium]|nr:DNA methyltransferase [Paludibacteraceae bacterium]
NNSMGNRFVELSPLGRYPSQTFVASEVAEKLDLQSGVSKSNASDYNFEKGNQENPSRIITNIKSGVHYDDTGGCSKILHKCDYEKNDFDLFIYNPKVSEQERNKGLQGFEKLQYSHDGRKKPTESPYQRNNSVSENNHPTLKPIELNKKILKLFKTPNEQVIIYPFAGSGSEIIGGHKANFRNWFACEINDNYTKIANARIKYFKEYDYEQLSLFDE